MCGEEKLQRSYKKQSLQRILSTPVRYDIIKEEVSFGSVHECSLTMNDSKKRKYEEFETKSMQINYLRVHLNQNLKLIQDVQ